jgi:uncharacterized coiled-coil DUF342 family protein
MSPIVMWLWIALATGVVIGVISFLPEYLGLRRRHSDACDQYDLLHAEGNKRLAVLDGKLQEKIAELNETTTERDRLTDELRVVIGERDRWKKSAADLEAERIRLKGEIGSLEGALAATRKRVADLEQERDGLALRLQRSEAELAEVRAERDRIIAERDEAIAAGAALAGKNAELTARIAELDAQIVGLTAEGRHLSSEVSRLTEEVAAKNEAIAQRDARIGTLEQERDRLSADIVRLEKEVAEKHEAIGKRDGQIETLKSQINELETERSRLTTEVAAHTDTIVKHTASIGAHISQIADLEAAHEDAIAKHAEELDQRDARIGAHVSQIAVLEADVVAHKETIEEHTAELAHRATRIETLRARSRNRLRTIRELEGRLQPGGTDVEQGLLARVESLRKQSRNRLKEIRRLEKEIAERGGDEAQRLERKLATARKRARERGRSLRKLEAAKLAFDAERSEWTAEAERLRENLDKLNDYIDHAKESDPPPSLVPPSWGDSPIIGLDFGTHSTKVVVRRRSGGDVRTRKPWALILDEPAVGYARMATPSLVRLVANDRLLFGTEALRQQEGRLFRSLKTSLLPCSDENGRAPDPMAPVLTAAYLAWILQRIADTIGGDPSKYTIAIGAPMNHEENAVLKDRYLHVVHAAFLGAFGDGDKAPIDFKKTVSLATIEPRIRAWVDRELPPNDFRRFHVRPETLAPLVSLHRDPKHKKPGVYMIVDMGAGSTEISVNQIQDTGNPEPWVLCHDDQTVRFGGDSFAANDEKNAFDEMACETEERSLVEKFWKHYREVCLSGYQKIANGTPTTKAAWSHMNIVRVGGALRRRALDEKIGRLPPLKERVLDASHEALWHSPSALDCWPPRATAADLHESGPIFAVADGLSIHPWWPEYRRPKEVATVPPPDRREDDGTWHHDDPS